MSAVVAPPAPATPPPAEAGPRPWKWTREDYYKLGDLGFFHGKRVELIRGEIVEMSPINRRHAIGVGLVLQTLEAVFTSGCYVDVQQPIHIPGADPSDPQPDVSVIPGARRDYPDHPTTALLLVEVSDATLFYDTTTKAELCATANVPDYWVLDLSNRQLIVFRDPTPLPDGGLAYRTRITLGATDTVTPLNATHATIRIADLLP